MKSGRKIHDSLDCQDDIRQLKNGELRTLVRYYERQAETTLRFDNMLCVALCECAERFMKAAKLKKVRKVLG